MHEGKRPGGLTALAIFNFIGSAGDFLGVLGLVAALVFVSTLLSEEESTGNSGTTASAEEQPAAEESGAAGEQPAESEEKEGLTDEQREQLDVLKQFGKTFWIVAIAADVVLGTLLLLSGIGYLLQKRFLGRVLGNVYAVCSLAATVAMMAMMPEGIPGTGFTIGTMLAIIYPALTLILLNTTFKEDLVH